MRHSITFWEDIATVETAKNTWKNWGLVPYQQPVFSTPKQKTTYIQLAGADGSIDLSTAITGYPLFQNRTGRFEFIYVGDWGRWLTIFDEIKDFLHGQRIIATLEDEPDWCYEGRFAVDNMYTDEQHGTIAISYEVEPYKKSTTRTTEPWLWNPFSFEHGVVGSGIYYLSPVSRDWNLDQSGLILQLYTDIVEGTRFNVLVTAPTASKYSLFADVTDYTELDDDAIPGIVYEFTAASDIEDLFVVIDSEDVSAPCQMTATVSFPDAIDSGNAGAFLNIELTTTAKPFDLRYTGNMPTKVTFSASNDNDVILTVVQGATTQSFEVEKNTTATIPGLTLYKNGWMYKGKPAVLIASAETGTAYITLDFRIGRL